MIICASSHVPNALAAARGRVEIHSAGRDPVPHPPDLPPLPPIEPDPLDVPQPGPYRRSAN